MKKLRLQKLKLRKNNVAKLDSINARDIKGGTYLPPGVSGVVCECTVSTEQQSSTGNLTNDCTTNANC